MAEETKPEKKPLMPWEENYQTKSDAPIGIFQGATEMAEKVIEGVKSFKWPWEASYTKKPTETPLRPSRASPEPVRVAPAEEFINKLIGVESGFNPEAKNPKSSATGLGQFTTATWKEAVASAGKDYKLSDRTDPVKSKEILRDFTEKNRQKAVSDLGRQPSSTELYLYHFLGRNAAGEFINAKDTALATDYVSGAAARANRNIFYSKGKPVTVGDVKERFKGKF